MLTLEETPTPLKDPCVPISGEGSRLGYVVMQILDLPSEILRNILEKLGPAELRRSVEYLLLCRRWYSLAHEVFLSSLSITDISFSARDLQLLPPRESPLMNLICERATRLSIRTVGHPSLQISKTPWISLPEAEKNDDDGADEDDLKSSSLERTLVTSGIDAGKIHHSAHLSCRPQEAWMRRINTKLVELADRLASCTSLMELLFEASSEQEASAGPRWDYVYDVSLAKIINGLPDNLTALTFDTCGTDIVPASEDPIHLCPLIAQHVGRVRTVRLRMRSVCPVIFNMANSLLAVESLIIRLSLPKFGDYSGGDNYFDAKRCFSKENTVARNHINLMCAAARVLARRHEFKMLRISFRDPQNPRVCLVAWDGITNQYLYEPPELYAYDDEGRAWKGWEDSETLQVGAGIY